MELPRTRWKAKEAAGGREQLLGSQLIWVKPVWAGGIAPGSSYLLQTLEQHTMFLQAPRDAVTVFQPLSNSRIHYKACCVQGEVAKNYGDFVTSERD